MDCMFYTDHGQSSVRKNLKYYKCEAAATAKFRLIGVALDSQLSGCPIRHQSEGVHGGLLLPIWSTSFEGKII